MVRGVDRTGADKMFLSRPVLDGVSSALDVVLELKKAEGELSARRNAFEADLPAEIVEEKEKLTGLDEGRRALVVRIVIG